MKTKQWMGMGLAAMLWGSSPAMAQFGSPAAAAPAAAPAANGAVAAAGEAKPGFFKRACTALDECRRKLCKTPAGQLLNSMTAPLSALTGGVIPGFCPLMPSLKDLAEPGVAGAANQAKKDALEAKARRDAVRYLGTLDCRYYPEAEAALIAALRTDRIECVRFEAALAFANGCCCTKKVLEALEICVSGSERDGNPAERSERVRDVASIALNKCLACFQEPAVEVVEPKTDIKEKPPTERKNDKQIDPELIEKAKKTAAMYQSRKENLGAAAQFQPTTLQKGQRSVYHIIRYGTDGGPANTEPAPRPVMMPVSRPANQPLPVAPIVAPTPRVLPQVKIVPPMDPVPVAESPVTTTSATTSPMPAATAAPVTTTAKVPAADADDVPPVQPLPAMTQVVEIVAPADPKPETSPMNQVATASAEIATPKTLPAAQAMMDKPTSNEQTINALIETLFKGGTPSDRHLALRTLATHDWRKNPQIVAGMVKTARLDLDRAVRVNAIRYMATLKMDLPYVQDHLKFMQKDSDEWVRQESSLALEKLQSAK